MPQPTEHNHNGHIDYAVGYVTYTCGCIYYAVNTANVDADVPDNCHLHPYAFPCHAFGAGQDRCLS